MPLPGSGLPVPTFEPVIRVRVLTHRGDAPVELRIGSEGQWLRMTARGDVPWSHMAAAPITVTRSGDLWQIVEPSGYRPRSPGAEVLRIAAATTGTDAAAATLELNGRLYPGSFSLHALPEFGLGAVDVVEHVELERYLPGVLARELYPYWSKAAHAAQAVAARSFAVAQIAQFADRRHFDVTNTQQSQAYIGLVERPRAIEGVEATRGLILTWRDEVVPCYYCSCCGGAPATARDAIGEHQANGIAPLAGAVRPPHCSSAPRFRWNRTRNRTQLARALLSFSQLHRSLDLTGFGELREIRPARVNAFGRPASFLMIDAVGESVEIGAELLRRACDHDLPAGVEPLPSAFFTATFEADVVHFDGRGHGHGVGMCQYGAQQMGLDGATYEQILATYYPQAQLTRAYD